MEEVHELKNVVVEEVKLFARIPSPVELGKQGKMEKKLGNSI